MSSVAISAGLIPLIRPAWPMESGRTRSNFSRASARSCGIDSIVEIGRESAFPPADEIARPARAGGRCSRRTWPRSSPGRSRPSEGRLPSAPGSSDSRSIQVVSGRRRDWNSVSPATRVPRSRSRNRPIALRRVSNRAQRRSSTKPTRRPSSVSLQVGVVVPEHQPILRAAGEHAIGLVDSPRDQVVDQDADVGPRAIEHERGLGHARRAPR